MVNEFTGKFSFLSNFHDSPILFDSDGEHSFIAPTVEHYFQASKTPNFEEALNIIGASTPGQAKRLGRRCMLRSDWEETKDVVMKQALILKFQEPELREKLLQTGDKYLKEGNWWHDNYWGSCYCSKCGDRGRNKLGQLLMEVRRDIQEGR